MSITISTLGRALLKTTPVAALPGSFIRDPNPPTFPRGVDGFAYEGPYLRNLREPQGRLLAVADTNNFTAAVLNEWTALAGGGTGDLNAVTAGYSLHDGARGLKMGTAKLNRMTIGGNGKRGPLNWDLSFMAAGAPTSFVTAATIITAQPVAAWHVYRDANIPPFLTWSLEWNYGLRTNEEIGLTASQYGSEVNSSPPVHSGRFLFDSQHLSSLVDGQAFAITVYRNYVVPAIVTITVENPIWHIPTDVELGRERSTITVPVSCARKANGDSPFTIA